MPESAPDDWWMAPTIGPYSIIGAHTSGEVPAFTKVVLDTNVAIDLERFYFGDRRKADREGLRKLLLTFPRQSRRDLEVDINYYWALQEAAWSRDGTFRAPKVRSMSHSLRRAVDWTPDEVEEVFDARRPPADRDRSWPGPLPEPADRGHHPLRELMTAYGDLLHICYLESTRSRWRHKGLIWPIERLRDWSTHQFGVRGAYEIALAMTLFLEHTPDAEGRVRRLLKFGGSESPDKLADKVWNAAWDLWFLRVIDGETYGLLTDEAQPTCLVSRNIDPEFIRARNQVRFIIDDGQGLPSVGVYSEWSNSLKHADDLQDLMDGFADDAYERSRRDSDAVFEQALAALQELESLMGIQRSTVEAFRRTAPR